MLHINTHMHRHMHTHAHRAAANCSREACLVTAQWKHKHGSLLFVLFHSYYLYMWISIVWKTTSNIIYVTKRSYLILNFILCLSYSGNIRATEQIASSILYDEICVAILLT